MKMARAQQDLEQFPGCTVVRVGSKRWSRIHDDILATILERICCFIQARAHLPFETLRQEFHQRDIRVRGDGDEYVHFLFGPEPIFRSGNELRLDVKGLICRPRARVHEGRLEVDF